MQKLNTRSYGKAGRIFWIRSAYHRETKTFYSKWGSITVIVCRAPWSRVADYPFKFLLKKGKDHMVVLLYMICTHGTHDMICVPLPSKFFSLRLDAFITHIMHLRLHNPYRLNGAQCPVRQCPKTKKTKHE